METADDLNRMVGNFFSFLLGVTFNPELNDEEATLQKMILEKKIIVVNALKRE